MADICHGKCADPDCCIPMGEHERRREMRALLDALGKAWERSPELALEHMLRDVTDYPCTLGDNDARLLSRLEAWRK